MDNGGVVLQILKEKRIALDRRLGLFDKEPNRATGNTRRIQGLLRAIEEGTTERYWDFSDVHHCRMSLHAYMVKWHGGRDKRDNDKMHVGHTFVTDLKKPILPVCYDD